jgi:hypothetical protein
MPRVLLLFLFFTVSFANAQDLTGVWQGHFRSGNMTTRSSVFDDRYKFEVQIAQHDKKLEAVTYSYLSSLFYGKATAAGTINHKTNKVLIQEGKLLEVRNQSGDVCIMTCFLQYTKLGDEEYLEGNFVSMNVRDSSNCGRGTVFLRKVTSSDFYKEPFVEKREEEIAKEKETPKIPAKPNPTRKATPGSAATVKKETAAAGKPATAVKRPSTSPKTAATPKTMEPDKVRIARISTPQAPQPTARMDSSSGIGHKFPIVTPRVLLSRSNQLVRSITVHTNEVTLNIYDDGAIDHDTISVYLDKKQVISHAMLTDRPIVLTLHLDETEDFHELVMVAENEGEIPPNTSLMIVKAGDKEYEVRITSTEQKNAVVTFKFEKLK